MITLVHAYDVVQPKRRGLALPAQLLLVWYLRGMYVGLKDDVELYCA